MAMRQWQAEALEKYRVTNPRTFLTTATPGAGKTTFALTLVGKLLDAKRIDQVIVVVPTDHLRKQWSDNAIEKGIFLDPSLSNKTSFVAPDFTGYVVTYAQVANNPGIHLRRATHEGKKTMVVFDEIHHAGDGLSWGSAIRMAFQNATRILALTGTPFRTSNDQIPFVKYTKESDGTLVSQSDYTYGYGEALKDHVVRPVTFAAYSGETSWSNSAGEVLTGSLGSDSDANELKAWRTALDPKGAWIKHVIQVADERLMSIRSAGMPDAGGMILASDQESAKAYAQILKKVTGVAPTVILSEDNRASKKINEFSDAPEDDKRWLVAVRMVSEGVDVPRLAVGVWATNYRTPMFFAQAVGRFVRSRRKGEVATVFLPAVKPLLALAASMEEKRTHVIAPEKEEEDVEGLDDHELEMPEIDEDEAEEKLPGGDFIPLEATAQFAHVLYGGKAYLGSRELTDEEEDYLGIPGLLSPDMVASMLQERDRELRKTSPVKVEEEKVNPFEAVEIRKDINRLVSRIALKNNLPHAQVHSRVKKAIPGPPSAHAGVDILKERLDWLEMNV
jgi:superfamily II DNA or RNA helicase